MAERFALIAAAGEMAREKLGLPWPKGEAVRAATVCFNGWCAARGGHGSGEVLAALQAIRSAIQRHGEARFREAKRDPGLPPIRDLLGYRFERDGEHLYGFTTTGWADTLQGIGNPRIIVGALYERGYLFCRSDPNHRFVVKIDGQSVATYAVRYSVLFDEAAAD
ncbi:hypothetical protein [Methylobacterium durans]|uniref:Uncharacterized protein n=1 Tax=Methylobacterium durans TaxID=2202825 RepID=A0A2U8W4Y7_9HYPH|nr:hypothetical protein [Methylobacterium durans]AWN40691.1 hypothetical protein DK389_09330 [Methylobacterium durans]